MELHLTVEPPFLVQVLELPGRLDVVGEQEELQVGRRRPHPPLRQERDRHHGAVLRESEADLLRSLTIQAIDFDLRSEQRQIIFVIF